MQYRAHLPPRFNELGGTSLNPLRPSTDFTKVFTAHAVGDIVTPTKTYKGVNFLFEYAPSLSVEPPAPLLKMLNEIDFKIPTAKHRIWVAHPITFYSSGWFFKDIHKTPGYNGLDVGFSTVPFRDEGAPWWGEYWDASMGSYYNPPPEWAFAEDARSYLYTGNSADPRVCAPGLIPSHLFDRLRYFIRFFDTVYILKPTEYARRRFYRLVEEDLPSIMRILQGLSWLEQVDVPDYLKKVPFTKGGVFLNISLGESYFLGAEVLEESGEGGFASPSSWILPTPSFYPQFLQSSTQEAFLENATWKYSPDAGYWPRPPQPTWWPVEDFDVRSVGISLLGAINSLPANDFNADREWLRNLLESGGHNHTFASYTTGYYDSQGNWIMPPFLEVPSPLLVWCGTSGSFIIGNPETEEVPAETVTKVFLYGVEEYIRTLGNIRYKFKIALTAQVRLAFLSYERIKDEAKVLAPPRRETIAKAVHPYFEVEDVIIFPYIRQRARKAQFKPRDYVRHIDYLSTPNELATDEGEEKITGAMFSYSTLPTGETSNVSIWDEEVPAHNSFVDIIAARFNDYDLGRSTRDWLEEHLKPAFDFAVTKIREYFTTHKFVHSKMPNGDVTCTALRTIEGAPRHDLPISVTTEREVVKLGEYMQKVGAPLRIFTDKLEGKCTIKRYIVGFIPFGIYSVAPDYERSFPDFFKKLKNMNAIVTDYPLTWSPKLVNFSGGAVSPPDLQFIPIYKVRERPQIALMLDFWGKRPMVRFGNNDAREVRYIFLKEPLGDDKQAYFDLLLNAVSQSLVDTEFALFEFDFQRASYVVKRYTQPIIVGAPLTFSIEAPKADVRFHDTYTVIAQADASSTDKAFTGFTSQGNETWFLWNLTQETLNVTDLARPLIDIVSESEYNAFWAEWVNLLFSEATARTGRPYTKSSMYDLAMFFFKRAAFDYPIFLRQRYGDVFGWARPQIHIFAPTVDALSYFVPSAREKEKYLSDYSYPVSPYHIPDPAAVSIVGTDSGYKKEISSGISTDEARLREAVTSVFVPNTFIPQVRRAMFRIRKDLVNNSVELRARAPVGFAISSYMTYAPLVPPTIEMNKFLGASSYGKPPIETFGETGGKKGQVVGSFAMSMPDSASRIISTEKNIEAILHTSIGDGKSLIQTLSIPYHQRKKDRVIGDPLWGTVIFDLKEYTLQALPLRYFRCFDIPPLGALNSVIRTYGSEAAAIAVTDKYKYKTNEILQVKHQYFPDEYYVKKAVALEGTPVAVLLPDNNNYILYHPPSGDKSRYAYDFLYATFDGYRVGYFKRKENAQDVEPASEGSIYRGYEPQISFYAWEEIWLEGAPKTIDGEEYAMHRLHPKHPYHWRVYILLALPERERPTVTAIMQESKPIFCSMSKDLFHEIVPVKCRNPLNAPDAGLVDFLKNSDAFAVEKRYSNQLKEKYSEYFGEKDPLIGIYEFNRLQKVIPDGMNALRDLVAYFPQADNENLRNEEALDDDELEKFNMLISAFTRIYEIPQSAIFSAYYVWDDDVPNRIVVRMRWQNGLALKVQERAAATLVILPKPPTFSFPFVMDSAEGEKVKILGYVRTAPAPYAPSSRFPYYLFYLHALRTFRYDFMVKRYGEDTANTFNPPFYPFDLIPQWVWAYIEYLSEYKDYKEQIKAIKELLKERWSELVTSIFIYPHVPSLWELEYSAAPPFVREVSLTIPYSKLKEHPRSLYPSIKEIVYEAKVVLGRSDPIYTHGRPNPFAQTSSFTVDLKGYTEFVPLGGALYHPIYNFYSYVYFLSPQTFRKYEKETRIGSSQYIYSLIPITLESDIEGASEQITRHVNLNAAQTELSYGAINIDILAPLSSVLESPEAVFPCVFERFPTERGAIIAHTQYNKAYEGTWTVMILGGYREHILAPVWGQFSFGDDLFKWHFDRGSGSIFHLSTHVIEGSAPAPKSVYPLLDRLLIDSTNYPYNAELGLIIKREDFSDDAKLRMIEKFLCLPPTKYPTFLLTAMELKYAATEKTFPIFLPTVIGFRLEKLTPYLKELGIQGNFPSLISSSVYRDLLSFLLYTARVPTISAKK